MDTYKLVSLEGLTGQSLFNQLQDVTLPEVFRPAPVVLPAYPYGVPFSNHEVWDAYTQAVIQLRIDYNAGIAQRTADIAAAITFFSEHFKIGKLVNGHFVIDEAPAWTYKQAVEMVYDVYRKDSFDLRVEIAWCTSQGMKPQYN